MPFPAEYEGKPNTGTTFSQRRAELDQIRFVAIRNMAYMLYTTQPDPNQPPKPLMTYNESLALDRDEVKKIVLQFELQNGLIQPDGTEVEYFSAPSAQQQGAPMATPPSAYPPPPPGYAQPGVPPGHQPPPAAAIPPGYAQPTPVPQAPPPSAAAAAGYPAQSQPPPGPPAQQYAPPQGGPPQQGPQQGEPPPAPKGRKRAQPQGGAVAPPPAAPPPAPNAGYQQPLPMGPPGAPPPAAGAGVNYPPPGVPAYPQPGQVTGPAPVAAAAPAGFDPGPLIAAIDRMGGGLAATSKTVDTIQAQINELKLLVLGGLMVQQWFLGQSQPLSDWLRQSGFDTTQGTVHDLAKLLLSRIPR
jgi:hypothetical protein